MHTASDDCETTAPMIRRRHALLGWIDPTEPHAYRGPFTRWPRSTDSALALVVFASSLITVSASAISDGEDFTISSITEQPVGVFVMLALASSALLWRRRRPIAVAAFVTLVMVAWAIAGHGDGNDLAIIVAAYSVGRYTTDHRYSLATVVAVMLVSTLDTIIDTNQRIDIAPAVIVTGLAWYVGRRVRNRGDYLALLQERAERLEADQHARARKAVADERSRIARELHDVVAHRVSMMTVQAGAARTVARDDLDAAIDAMVGVEQAGRQALGELRHLLGVLRPDISDADDLGPQPGLSEVTTLTDQLSDTGADVTLTISSAATELPVAVDLSAYRIVQESLTNIIKHAGPNPTVAVTIGVDDDCLAIDISNSATTTPASLPSSGYGIAGMRERAHLLGGTLTATSQSPDRFRVQARLPVTQEQT